MRELHRLRDFNILYLDLLGSLTETNKANAVCIILLEILEVNFNFCPIARLKYTDKYTMWNNSDTLRLRMFTSKQYELVSFYLRSTTALKSIHRHPNVSKSSNGMNENCQNSNALV